MMEVYAKPSDEKYFHRRDYEKANTVALKVATKWLAKESVRRIGKKLRIRASALRRRVRVNRIEKNTGGVWYGLDPLSLAYARDYHQTPTGVQSGERFYKGAFAQVMSGSRELVWTRAGERPKSTTRKKRSPNGTQRRRKSPPVKVVREEIDDDLTTETDQIMMLQEELQAVYQEAFINELER
ncbi:hypothetical protein L1D52_24110 [Vibrio brasiliensis]|uniref:hypothetical protein n=1 Tax=Vibrio brasiliensis TaxID=170652 RepID=UPI001EFCE1D5|nr:hypothetical protein [Vibrio brasiliensis]MCG9785397.1 hypothetical protein [Vibrio brasiliensis]